MTTEAELGPDSSIKEIFDAIQPDEGMRVLPTQVPADEGKANLAILITGKSEEANVVMANLMSYVNDMHDTAEQAAADSEIVGPDGKPANGESPIILP